MGRKWQSMTGWFAPRCAYVHDCHSNTPLCTHPRTHACTCLGSGTTKRPNQHQASQANNTTGSINLSRVADDGQHAAMKCGCRVKRWDCINEYRRKTSCHREFELVHDWFGQGQKLSHSLPPPPLFPSRQMAQTTRGNTKNDFTSYEGNKQCCVTIGMACFCTDNPQPRTWVPQFSRHSQKQKAISGSSISFSFLSFQARQFPHFHLMFCNVQAAEESGGKGREEPQYTTRKVKLSETTFGKALGRLAPKQKCYTFVRTWWREAKLVRTFPAFHICYRRLSWESPRTWEHMHYSLHLIMFKSTSRNWYHVYNWNGTSRQTAPQQCHRSTLLGSCLFSCFFNQVARMNFLQKLCLHNCTK